MSSKDHVEDQKGTAHSSKDLFLGETLHHSRLQHVNVGTASLMEPRCNAQGIRRTCRRSSLNRVHQSTIDTTKAANSSIRPDSTSA